MEHVALTGERPPEFKTRAIDLCSSRDARSPMWPGSCPQGGRFEQAFPRFSLRGAHAASSQTFRNPAGQGILRRLAGRRRPGGPWGIRHPPRHKTSGVAHLASAVSYLPDTLEMINFSERAANDKPVSVDRITIASLLQDQARFIFCWS